MASLPWLGLLAIAGCYGQGIVPCSDGTACPSGLRCIEGGCATGEQIAACAQATEGEACTYDDRDGRCSRGACVAAMCGDGRADPPERCDGNDLGVQSCVAEGFHGGTLGCTPECELDTSLCAGRCGDNSIDASETCDGVVASGCFALGAAYGRPGCTGCGVDQSPCRRFGWRTGYTSSSTFDYGFRAPDALFMSNGVMMRRYVEGQPVQSWTLETLGGLRGLHGSSSTNAYFVATRSLFRFDGVDWTAIHGSIGYLPYLDVHAVSDTRVLIQGSNLVVYDGTNATPVTPPPPYGFERIVASATEIWGLTVTGAVYHFDGVDWSTGSDANAVYLAIARSGSEVVAVGVGGAIGRWNAATRSIDPMISPTTLDLTRVLEVGNGRFIAAAGLRSLFEFDGRMWGTVRSPSIVDSNEVVAAALDSMGRLSIAASYRVYHSDLRLVDVPLPMSGKALWASERAVWASAGLLARNGVPITNVSGALAAWGLDGAAEVVFVVGNDGAARCTPASCTTDPLIGELHAVHGTGETNVWAVGSLTLDSDGIVFRWNGAAWMQMSIGTQPPLRGVSAVSASDVYAVGGANILHYDGTGWTTTIAPNNVTALSGVIAFPGGRAIAVGRDAILELSNGVWSVVNPGAPTMRAVLGTSLDDVVALGEPRLFHRDANGWLEAELPELAASPAVLQRTPDGLWVGAGSVFTKITPRP